MADTRANIPVHLLLLSVLSNGWFHFQPFQSVGNMYPLQGSASLLSITGLDQEKRWRTGKMA